MYSNIPKYMRTYDLYCFRSNSAQYKNGLNQLFCPELRENRVNAFAISTRVHTHRYTRKIEKVIKLCEFKLKKKLLLEKYGDQIK